MPESKAPIPFDTVSLDELRALLETRGSPPLDRWDPPLCGHSGMQIGRDERWFHDGDEIRRSELIRLFASILKREADGRHVLVTPVEKLEIDVESTAFRAVEMKHEGDGRLRRVAFQLDSGDVVIVGRDHPLRLIRTQHGPSPRLAVRHGLEAELTRPVYYELAVLALAESSNGIWSEGIFFPLDCPV